MGKNAKPKISGRDATYVALEAAKREPICIVETDSAAVAPANSPAPSQDVTSSRRAPPRLCKPDARRDQCMAPTPDLAAHRESLREALGQTMSDEFVGVMLGKLIEVLRPSPFDHLKEATLNAALALISSIQPRTELEAMLAVQIVATGFSGLRFLRQSQHHMDDAFIDVYGGYARRLLRLQLDLIKSLDHHRRGHNQTVEVRHVHLHPGSQGVVGIVNREDTDGG